MFEEKPIDKGFQAKEEPRPIVARITNDKKCFTTQKKQTSKMPQGGGGAGRI